MKYTNKNQRKNRPKKKEIAPEVWDNTLENLRRQFEYGKRKEEEKQQGVSNPKTQ